jgi:hypothetical protein
MMQHIQKISNVYNMKFYLLLLCYLIMNYSCNTTYKSKNPLYRLQTENELDAIRKIDFKAYYTLPIDSLLKHPLLKNYIYKRVVDEPNGCLWYYSLTFYSKNSLIDVNIYPPNELKFVPKRCIKFPHEQWDLKLLEKEAIVKIDFF